MKKTLAIVLALAMVLCMIPATFAATNESVIDRSYGIKVYSINEDGTINNNTLGDASDANSVTAKYDYEKLDEVDTGRFTESKKMALVEVGGFKTITEPVTEYEVTIDGKKLEVNTGAKYKDAVGYFNGSQVNFPVELTKAGYTDTYLVVLKRTTEDVVYTETAKITVKFENTSSYKNAKTATISKIESKVDTMDAYIVGSKIYLDFVQDTAQNIEDALELTFKNENGSLFNVVTWAAETTSKGGKGGIINLAGNEDKLDDSKMTYNVNAQDHGATDSKYRKELVFNLETSSAIYETKEYEVVVRTNVIENDPKGIYFAEGTKTIRIGESYTPVVMGVATNKKVNAKIKIGERDGGTPVNNDVIDIEDEETVIGTKEGVAFIYAEYTTNDGKLYRGSSAKITVTAGEVVDDTVSNTYRVTASSLNVRKGPGTSYAKAYSLSNGQTVKVDSIANGWAKLSDGNYVSAQYLVKVSAPTTGNGDTMYVTCRTLNVRKGPGTSYAKAGTLSRGNAVKVVNVTNGWAELDNGTYVSYKYLSK